MNYGPPPDTQRFALPPQSPRKVWPWFLAGCGTGILGTVVVGLIVLVVALSVPGTPAAAPPPPPTGVVFEVAGTGRAIVGITGGQSNGTARTVDLPWRMTSPRTESRTGLEAYGLSITGGGNPSCRITVDGQTVATTDRSGGTVSCFALPR